ncbi:hypothetical protein ZWY2020_011534 [Hordeum vulgare]|nr:hypothetical protein ZWY2020_011534 [Hordeum vulgare]
MYGGAVASLVDLVGSAVFFAGGSPTTGSHRYHHLLPRRRLCKRTSIFQRFIIFLVTDRATNGVSWLEILINKRRHHAMQEEIEIEARVLGIGDKTGCVTVEVRRKASGAHGRHTKYLAAVSSKL